MNKNAMLNPPQLPQAAPAPPMSPQAVPAPPMPNSSSKNGPYQGTVGSMYEQTAASLVKNLRGGNAPQVAAIAKNFLSKTHGAQDASHINPAFMQHTFNQFMKIYNDPNTNAVERRAAIEAAAMVKMRANRH